MHWGIAAGSLFAIPGAVTCISKAKTIQAAKAKAAPPKEASTSATGSWLLPLVFWYFVAIIEVIGIGANVILVGLIAPPTFATPT